MEAKVKPVAYFDCGVKSVGSKFAAYTISVNTELPEGNFAYEGHARDTFEEAEIEVREMMKAIQEGIPIERIELQGGVN